MLCWGDEMQQSTGFHVGSFLSWQVAELLLAFQHGGEGTVCVCVCVPWFHQLFRNYFGYFMGMCHSVSLVWQGSLQSCRSGRKLQKSGGLEKSTGSV